RVDGRPVTSRAGKPVEVNALWIEGLGVTGTALERAGRDASAIRQLEDKARRSFAARFHRPDGRGLYDVIDGPDGDDASVRPNQLLATGLVDDPASMVAAVEPLVTPLGLRSLSPSDARYTGSHRGSPPERDSAYHQ